MSQKVGTTFIPSRHDACFVIPGSWQPSEFLFFPIRKSRVPPIGLAFSAGTTMRKRRRTEQRTKEGLLNMQMLSSMHRPSGMEDASGLLIFNYQEAVCHDSLRSLCSQREIDLGIA